MATALAADQIFGKKLYQERARAAFPLLVRQAEAGVPIFYSSLARELGMKNPRNLNYVLGCIGQTVEAYSTKWGVRIPPIQCLVVNKGTGVPGAGISWFLVKESEFAKLSLKRRRDIVQGESQVVYAFSRWRELLAELELEPASGSFVEAIRKASAYRGGGESRQHRELKEYIAANPASIGLSTKVRRGETEVPLASGDCLDVSFRTRTVWIAVEVKSDISGVADITRGIFQCVKYRAVLDAMLLSQGRPQNSRAILALGGAMPQELMPLANILGVEFIDNVVVKKLNSRGEMLEVVA